MRINKTCLKVDGIGVSTSKVLLNSKPFSIVKLSFDVKSYNVYPMMLQNNFLLMLMMLLVDCKLLHWKRPQIETMMWLKLIIKPCVFNVVSFCFKIICDKKRTKKRKKNQKYYKKNRLTCCRWVVMEAQKLKINNIDVGSDGGVKFKD